ncbi:MAG: DNA primase [Desulfobacteraceae bacterium]|nr:DNA primase [Desulfobacteraceae bacterium]
MAYPISEEKISEIRNTANIVNVVSEVVQLRKTGKNFVGLCPFHSEKTPSFTVNPDKQIFHCFGCHEGGNVVSFVMKHDRLSFPEALRSLAKKHGIDIPEPLLSEKEKKQYSEKETLYKINRLAADFYHRTLLNNEMGRATRDYLSQRNIKSSTINQFNLGFAPEGWQDLLRFLQKKGNPEGLVEKAGLIIPKKTNDGHYDRFRNRLIFPIYTIAGQVAAFGGRAIDDGIPKYLNSPETPLFNKRQILFGLDKAKNECRETDTVFVVEGYMDCIMLFQEGLTNTVATLGTAMTPEHIRILRGFAQKVILVYDSDEAGIKAANRSIGLFMEYGVDARILALPEGHDPDSFVREYGMVPFKQLALEAFSMVEFLIQMAIKKHGLTVSGKIEMVNDLLAPMAATVDPVARALYLKKIAERVGIDESAIAAKLKAFMNNRENILPGFYEKMPEDHLSDFSGKSQGSDSPTHRLERQLLSVMLQYPKVISDIKKHNLIKYFNDPLLKSIGMIIINSAAVSSELLTDLIQKMEDAEKRRIVTELAIQNEGWDETSCRRLVDRFILSIQGKKEIKDLNEEIKFAEKNNDTERLLYLLGEKQKNAVFTEQKKMKIMRR